MRRLKILHLEDSPADAELVRRSLTKAGIDAEVEVVASRDAFRDSVRAGFDVIIADYHLPGFDGIEALRIARTAAQDVPFIFVSGSIGEERAIEALREGATDYVLKDRPSRLPSAVLRAVDERSGTSARRRAEDELRRSEERFQRAAFATRDVIWEWDLQTGACWTNAAMRTEWGHPADTETTLEAFIDKVHPDDRERIRENLESALASGATRVEGEYRFQRADGSFGHVYDRGTIVRDPDGQPIRMIGAMQDVSRRRQLEEQVTRADRADSIGRIATTVAHEFNNVLMAIQPFAELISARVADPALRHASGRIIAAVGRGREITQAVLASTHERPAAKERVDVCEWLRNAVADVRNIVGDEIDVQLDASAAPCFVDIDPAHLHQVVSNLAANGRDAMKRRGRLRVTVGRSDTEVHLTVADEGAGIPESVLPNIFAPLFTTKPNGTGLGLAVVQRLVAANGGSIEVESTVGRGTTFTAVFPRKFGSAGTATPAGDSPYGQLPVDRVLIIDDDEGVAEGVAALLDLAGVATASAGSADGALEALTTSEPDLIILDVGLGEEDGVALFHSIRRRWPDLPTLFATGHGSDSDLREALNESCVGYLLKPFDFETLAAAIRRIVPCSQDDEALS